MSTVQLKFEMLIRKLSYVKSDLEFHRAEHQKRREVFEKDVAEYIEASVYTYSRTKAEKNFVYPYDKQRAVEVPDLEKQTKEIFKKVAKVTHPDVVKDSVREKKFMEARAALEGKDWFSMYEISTDLSLEVTNISDEHIKWLEQEISMIESIIKGIVTTFEWAYSNDGANKQQLLTTYCMLTCKIKDE